MGIKKTTLTDEVFHLLKSRIVDGSYAAGHKLKQDELCAELKVSSSPVREALNKLAAAGWVDSVPHAGKVVRKIDAAELQEIYAVRLALESLAVEQAASRVDAGVAATLRALAKEICDGIVAKDAKRVVDAEGEFHRTLVAASGNRTLQEFFVLLLQRGKAFLTKAEHFGQRREETATRVGQEHEELIQALEKGDVATALRLIKGHIRIKLDVGE